MRHVSLLCGMILLICGQPVVRADDPVVDTFTGLPSGGSTTWGAGGNWSLGRPPMSSEIGSISFNDTRDRTITIDQNAAGLSLSAVNAGGGELTLTEGTGIDLNFGNETFGAFVSDDARNVSASFVQTGGTNSAANAVYVGGNGIYYGTGSYSISGGTLQTAALYVGQYNTGYFTQSGGSVLTGGLELGQALGSNGNYQISAGNFHSTGTVYVGGDYGNGTFNQTGGSVQIDSQLRLGFSGGPNTAGTYSISSDSATLHAQSEALGDHSTGTIVQSAGTNTVDNSLIVGFVYRGDYELSGGTLNVGTLVIASSVANGTFNQTGGVVTVGSLASLSQFAMQSSGTYNLSGANSKLTVNGYGSIGQYGPNLFNQSAGAATFSVELDVVQNAQYLLSGGSLYTTYEMIEYNGSPPNATVPAVFNQSGGTQTVASRLLIGSDGSFGFSGGMLSTGTLTVLSGGTFNWSAGKLSVGTVIVDGQMSLSSGHDKTLAVKSFSIDNSTAKLDLADDSLVIGYASTSTTTLSTLRDALHATALTSSVADVRHAIGYADNAILRDSHFGDQTFATGQYAQVLAGLTFIGDANLDGKVDIGDLGTLATHWQQSGYWQDGDFNYDGKVDIGDLGLLATNWQAGADGHQSFADALAQFDLTAVPEPTTAAAGLCSLLLLRRNRRGRRRAA